MCAGVLITSVIDNPVPGGAAILVSKPQTYAEAAKTCALLGESLWTLPVDPASLALESVLKPLAYEVYRGRLDAKQRLWVSKSVTQKREDAPTPGARCTSIDSHGKTNPIACDSKLPVLCSQSAPVSTLHTEDPASRWRISHPLPGGSSLVGFRDHYVWKFLGARFAPEPKKFEFSTAHKPAAGAREEALVFPKPCTQVPNDFPDSPFFSDDCLFANVWTPALPAPGGGGPGTAKAAPKRPVMVYFYGGGFVTGGIKNTNTDCTNLASRGDVVCVAVAYRVGAPGWMAFDDGVHKGNYAISDMVNALQWVHDHAAAFGGDPERVTIFGESAGAWAVRVLLSSPKAKGLFRRAIMQSGPLPPDTVLSGTRYGTTKALYERVSVPIIEKMGCASAEDKVECMRGVNMTEVIQIQPPPQSPAVDGNFLPYATVPSLAGKPWFASDVDVIVGMNRDELGTMIPPPASDSLDEYLALLKSLVGADLSPFFAGQPAPSTAAEIYSIVSKKLGDALFRCGTAAVSAAGAAGGFASTWSYEFNRTYSPRGYTTPWCDPAPSPGYPHGDPEHTEYMKCHGGEQIVMFGNIGRGFPDETPDRDGRDLPFFRFIVDYWWSFAWNEKGTDGPNPDPEVLNVRGFGSTLERVGKAGKWEPVGAGKPKAMMLQWESKMVDILSADVEQFCALIGMPLDYFAHVEL